MFDASIRLAVVAIVVALATRGLRRSAPAAAHRLWMMVPAAGVALVACAWAVRPVAFVHPAGALATWLPGPESASAFGRIAGAIYVAGLALFLMRIVAGMLTVGRLVRGAHPIPDAQRARLEEEAEPCRRVRFAQSAALQIPVTAGILRPTILLPGDWPSWPDERVRAVVRHEIAHVARRDYLCGVLTALAQAILWFHPAVWIAGSRASLCAELACDRIASGDRPADEYAEHLLAVASRRVPRLRHGWSLGATTRLDERIDALLAGHAVPPARARAVSAACAACALLLLVATPIRIVALRWASPAVSQGYVHDLPRPLRQHIHEHP